MAYYIDQNDNRYIDLNGNYFVPYLEGLPPTKLNYLLYNSYIKNNEGYKKYSTYIYKDGAYVKVKPYINTEIEIAIAGLAIAGISRVSS